MIPGRIARPTWGRPLGRLDHGRTEVTLTIDSPLECRCKRVQLQLSGPPILAAECHCNSCRKAGALLLSLPGASRTLEENGGTRFVLYRKDRVRFHGGVDRLAYLRLGPKSTTRRVVATCCNTPIFLEFEKGHWLSLYGRLWPEGTQPRPELRTMTSDLPDPGVLDDDLPNAKRQSLSFFLKLLGAWIAMGFKAPRVSVGPTEITLR